MNRHYILLLLATITLLSCNKSNQSSDTQSNVSDSSLPLTPETPDPQPEQNPQPSPTLRKVDNSIGVVQHYNAKTITLLNDDNTVWMTFDYIYDVSQLPNSYTMDDVIALFPTWKNSFEPWAFKIDYFLVFKCMAVHEDSYTVVVNENTLETKKLAKTEGLNYQSWNEHIKEGAIIGLYQNFNNQLRKSPNIDSEVIFTDTEFDAYEGKEIQGDWVKVHNFTSDHGQEGWVRWREEGLFLIEFYYSM